MRIWQVIALTLLIGTGLPVYLHDRQFHLLSPWQITLAFFLWLNVIIALWEICLFLRIDMIRRRHQELSRKYGGGHAIDRSVDFMRSRVALAQIFSPSSWIDIWTSYAGFDESYVNQSSYGFFVDVGNGFTTLVPSLLFLYGMTYEIIPARALGIVGILLFYQMWYGTVVYLGSFFFNKRYVGHPLAHLAIIVGLLNGLWLTFPLAGIYASVYMVYTSSYSLFH